MAKTSSSERRPRLVEIGDMVRYHVPDGDTVPAIIVAIDKDHVAALQVFRTSGDGCYLIRNIRFDHAGGSGTYRP